MLRKIKIETTSYLRREFKSCNEDLIILENEDLKLRSENFTKSISVHLYPDSEMLIEVKEDSIIVDFQAYLPQKSQYGIVVKKGETCAFDEDNFTYDIEAKHYVTVE